MLLTAGQPLHLGSIQSEQVADDRAQPRSVLPASQCVSVLPARSTEISIKLGGIYLILPI